MTEVVNLKQARKRKLKAEREAVAEANRQRHGRTKSERRIADARKELADRRLDAQKLDQRDGDKADDA